MDAIFHEIDYPLANHLVARVRAYCFAGEALILLHHASTGEWMPPRGALHPGETVKEAAARVVLERARMRVTTCHRLGYLEYQEPKGSVLEAVVACTVEPEHDSTQSFPPLDVDEIRAVHLPDVPQYVDWSPALADLLHRARASQSSTDSQL